MTSYDELLKQVRSLRAENSNLRQELTDNTCHLTAIETEASGVTDAMATDPLDVDDDSDNDINYDENGIHVFHQGGGGEGRDLISSGYYQGIYTGVVKMSEDLYLSLEDIEEDELVIGEDGSSNNTSKETSEENSEVNSEEDDDESAENDSDEVEEDISPNDVYGLKPFHVPAPDTSHPHNGLATHQNGLATQSPQDRPDQTYNKDVHTELLEHVKALLIERSEILRQIQDEDQQRKWYIAQLDNIRQKLEKIPYHDGYNRQSEAARGKVEYEAKQLQESFEQSFGTQEQISQRQDVRLQRVHAIESTVRQIQQQHRDKIDLTSLDVTSSQEPQSHHNVQMRKSRDESVAGPNPGMNSENGDSSVIDPAVMNLASLYHGAWPLSPMKRAWKTITINHMLSCGMRKAHPRGLVETRPLGWAFLIPHDKHG
ncbi:hypothetical protein FSP39_014451 [Pinctada imbricata]|uniref:Adenomatous polyposis coli N-terminal dimerisation domain-containing protein n=1 Tax=Pinctada imbricata TaxID=66713 RepID=A0AA88Y0G8_PINIB|nr:hypothetical protein FSP39_014451 [Pinctada imbricata]